MIKKTTTRQLISDTVALLPGKNPTYKRRQLANLAKIKETDMQKAWKGILEEEHIFRNIFIVYCKLITNQL